MAAAPTGPTRAQLRTPSAKPRTARAQPRTARAKPLSVEIRLPALKVMPQIIGTVNDQKTGLSAKIQQNLVRASSVTWQVTLDPATGTATAQAQGPRLDFIPQDLGTPSFSADDFIIWLISYYLGHKPYSGCEAILQHNCGADTIYPHSSVYHREFYRALERWDQCLFAPLSQFWQDFYQACPHQNHYRQVLPLELDAPKGAKSATSKQRRAFHLELISGALNSEFHGTIYQLSPAGSPLKSGIKLKSDPKLDADTALCARLHQFCYEDFELKFERPLTPARAELLQVRRLWYELQGINLPILSLQEDEIEEPMLTPQQEQELKRYEQCYRQSHFTKLEQAHLKLSDSFQELFGIEQIVAHYWLMRDQGEDDMSYDDIVATIHELRAQCYPEMLATIEDLIVQWQDHAEVLADPELQAVFSCAYTGFELFTALKDQAELTIDPDGIMQQNLVLPDPRLSGPNHVEDWERRCHFLTCFVSLQQQGLGYEQCVALFLTLWIELLAHAIEQAACECWRRTGNLKDLPVQVFGLELARYQDSFPLYQRVSALIDAELPLDQDVLTALLTLEQERLSTAQR